MNEISANTIKIGFGIFITLIIFTVAMTLFNQMNKIQGELNSKSIPIKGTVESIYDIYNGAVLNSVELVNTLKKYEDNQNVIVIYSGGGYAQPSESALETAGKTASQYLNDQIKEESTIYRYETLFNVNVTRINSIYTINFVKK